MKNKFLMLFIAMLLITTTASASILSNILNRFASQPEQINSGNVIYTNLPSQEDGFNTFYNEIAGYNTPENINLISTRMNDYEITNLKIHVSDYDKDFYVVPWQGITLQPPEEVFKTITLSSKHIRTIEGYLADGILTGYEQLNMAWMYRFGG